MPVIYFRDLMFSLLFFRRLLGGTLLVVVVVLVVVVFSYFSNSRLHDKSPTVRAPAVDVALKSFHLTESEASVRKWELFANSGEYDKAADMTSLKDLRFVIERDGKGGPVTITSRHGEYAHASKNVYMQGDVLVRTAEGSSFATPKVMYNSNSRLLSSTERVKLVDAALTVEGTGFDVSIDSREARVHSNVTATIYPGKRQR